jgi:hypothetical protein
MFYKLKLRHEVVDVDVIGFQCKICMFLTSMMCNRLAPARNFKALYSIIVSVFILLIIYE